MREKLKGHVNSLFRDVPDTVRNRELREEILQNTLDRFDDLVAQGYSEDSAYTQAVGSIGDVRQLWEAAPPKEKKRYTGWVIFGCVAAAAVVALVVGLGVHLLCRPAPAHYAPSQESSLRDGVGALVDWATDLADEAVDFSINWSPGSNTFHYDHAEQYTAGPVELSGADVRALSLNWLSGQVTVEVYDGDQLIVSEAEQADGDLQLHWRLDGQKLIVQPFAAGTYTDLPDKELLVQVPAALASGLQSVKVDTTSAGARISGLTLETFQFESISGSLTAEAACRKLEAETTSGGVEFTGTADQVELETVSGGFVLTLAGTPDELSFDSTSGGVTLILPPERSFRAELDTVSGVFRCDYETQVRDHNTWRYTGSSSQSEAELEFDTVSGNVDIRKAP